MLRNATYIQSDQGYVVGIVGADAPDGPLTLRVADLSGVLAAGATPPGAPFRATATVLTLGEAVQITGPLDHPWQPAFPSQVGSAVAQGQAAATLRGYLQTREASAECSVNLPFPYWERRAGRVRSAPPLQAHGCAPGIAARRIAAQLADFAAARAAGDAEAASKALIALLGLGRGLTPAGDDVVAGLLAMLVWQRQAELLPATFVAPLVAAVRGAAPERTNRISARLIWHAGAGVLYEPAMTVGAAVLAGDPAGVAAAARRLLAIGHSSGADLARGLLAGLP